MDNYENVREKILIAMNSKGFSKNESNSIAQMLDFIMKDYDLQTKETGIVVYDGNAVDQIVEYYCMAMKSKDYRDATVDVRRQTLNRFFRIVGKLPSEIEHQDIYMYKYIIMKEGAAGNTVNTYLSTISAFFKWAVKRGIAKENPIESEDRSKVRDKEKLPLTEKQIDSIRDTIETMSDKELFRAMFEFMLATGLRREEIVKAKKEDFCWERADASTIPFRVPDGKGGKERYTFVPRTAMVYVNRYLLTRKDDLPELFLNRKGTPLKKDVVNDLITEIRDASGIQFLTPHTLRRTYATLAVQRGVAINAVARTMGHASVNTTMVYAKDTMETLMSQFERAGAYA